MFNMSTNKTYYQEAMRGHDRALSNLENIPQGFQHLVQMQKSMKDAEGTSSGHTPKLKAGVTASEPKKQVETAPFPNPWSSSSKGSDRLGLFLSAMGNPSDLPGHEALSAIINGEDKRASSPDGEQSRILERLSSQKIDDADMPTETEDEDEECPNIPFIVSPVDAMDMGHYAVRFYQQLKLMRDLGFADENENIRALLKSGGSVSGAIEWLTSRKAM